MAQASKKASIKSLLFFIGRAYACVAYKNPSFLKSF
jgi:hypothetical protein